MTAPAPSPYEQSEIDRFGIFAEDRVVEEVARALSRAEYPANPWELQSDGWREHRRRLAAAAVAAYRATQDGGAEEAVRRVEALAAEFRRDGLMDSVPGKSRSDQVRAGTLLVVWDRLRAALAPQAGDGERRG